MCEMKIQNNKSKDDEEWAQNILQKIEKHIMKVKEKKVETSNGCDFGSGDDAQPLSLTAWYNGPHHTAHRDGHSELFVQPQLALPRARVRGSERGCRRRRRRRFVAWQLEHQGRCCSVLRSKVGDGLLESIEIHHYDA